MAETEVKEEQTNETIEPKDERIEDTEAVKAGDTTVYTPEKQMLDQERANTRRAREELESLTEAFEAASEELQSVKDELAGLKTANEAEKRKLETQQQRLEDMDPQYVDEKVIRNMKVLEQQLRDQQARFDTREAELNARIQELTTKATTYEQERAEQLEERRKTEVREAILSRVEKSLERQGIKGAGKYRTEAHKLADELVDSGEVKQPKNVIDALDLMEDCYLKVRAKHEKGKDKTVSVDTGRSGITPPGEPQRKSGSLDEVAADMLKDQSWRKD